MKKITSTGQKQRKGVPKSLALTLTAISALLAFGAEDTKAAEKFTDVSESYWGFPYINELSEKGIIGGYPDVIMAIKTYHLCQVIYHLTTQDLPLTAKYITT